MDSSLFSWIIALMTCSNYQFWIFRALAYLLMIIVYLIIIDLRKEIGTDQYDYVDWKLTITLDAH